MLDPWGDPEPQTVPARGFDPWDPDGGPGIKSGPRASWTPNRAAFVLTKCGHIELEWPLIKALGGKHFVPTVYCEECQEWMPYRRATAIEIMRVRNSRAQTLF